MSFFSDINESQFGESLTRFNLTNYKHRPYNPLFSQKNSNPKNNKSPKKITPLKNIQRQDLALPSQRSERCNFRSKELNQSNIWTNLNREKRPKYNKRKAKSQLNILVTSRSQKQLISLLKNRNLPKITIQNQRKISPLQKLTSIARDEQKFQDYKKQYFGSLSKLKKHLQSQLVQKQFPQIKIHQWIVKGFLISDNLLLKATLLIGKSRKRTLNDKKQTVKYKKFPYSQTVKNKVKESYYLFVKNWLFIQDLIKA